MEPTLIREVRWGGGGGGAIPSAKFAIGGRMHIIDGCIAGRLNLINEGKLPYLANCDCSETEALPILRGKEVSVSGGAATKYWPVLFGLRRDAGWRRWWGGEIRLVCGTSRGMPPSGRKAGD